MCSFVVVVVVVAERESHTCMRILSILNKDESKEANKEANKEATHRPSKKEEKKNISVCVFW